jgi:CSLREA domain-containing protein
MARLLGLAAIAGALLAFAAGSTIAPVARGADYTVTRTTDPGGTCAPDPAPGHCSLREAVNAAESAAGFDFIHVPAGDYTLEAIRGPLDVTTPMAIDGAGAETVVSGGGATRVLNVFGATAVGVSISDLAITGGSAANAGAISVGLDPSVTLTNVSVTSNTATASGPDGAAGGGILNQGTLTLVNSTVSGNTADPGTGTGGRGGGISNTGVLSLTNSTISGNVASPGPTAGGRGGGIDTTTAVSLTSTTLAGNGAAGGFGGNLFSNAATVSLANTIIAGGSASNGSNCFGQQAVVSGGRNLESADTCGLPASDLKNADPQLGSLQLNGGPTATQAPAGTSPAVNAAVGCPPPDTDQRGVARPQLGACDIGAVEIETLVGGGAAARDLSAPLLSDLRLSRSKFTPIGGRGSSVARKRRRTPAGTRVSYKLSEAGTVWFRVQRASKGRRVKGRCVAPKRRRRGRRCTRYLTLKGTFTRVATAGANGFRFTGRVNNKRLRAGRYRFLVSPRDAAGNYGKSVRKAFRIVRR